MERTGGLARFFEGKLLQTPEVEKFVTSVFEQRARIRITFPESIEQTQIPVAIKEQMMAYSYQFGGADVQVYGYGPSFYGGGGSPPNYTISIFGYNYERVRGTIIQATYYTSQFNSRACISAWACGNRV